MKDKTKLQPDAAETISFAASPKPPFNIASRSLNTASSFL